VSALEITSRLLFCLLTPVFLVSYSRYESESAGRLCLHYEPSAAVKGAVDLCDKIACELRGIGNDELEEYGGECAVGEEQGVGRIGILNEDIQESLFDLLDLEHEEDKPFDDLQMALCLATDPFPDLKACSDEANSNHVLHFPPHKL